MMLALRLPKEIEDRLTALAEKTGRTKSYYAREAIIQHIEDLEDIYIAEKMLEDVKAGREETISLDELMAEYDMES